MPNNKKVRGLLHKDTIKGSSSRFCKNVLLTNPVMLPAQIFGFFNNASSLKTPKFYISATVMAFLSIASITISSMLPGLIKNIQNAHAKRALNFTIYTVGITLGIVLIMCASLTTLYCKSTSLKDREIHKTDEQTDPEDPKNTGKVEKTKISLNKTILSVHIASTILLTTLLAIHLIVTKGNFKENVAPLVLVFMLCFVPLIASLFINGYKAYENKLIDESADKSDVPLSLLCGTLLIPGIAATIKDLVTNQEEMNPDASKSDNDLTNGINM